MHAWPLVLANILVRLLWHDRICCRGPLQGLQ